MHPIPVLLAIVVATVFLLTAGAALEDPVVRGLRRRQPGLGYDRSSILLVVLAALAAFAFGLMVMYAVR